MKRYKPKPRLYRGFRDIFASDLLMRQQMLDSIREVYELYGFAPLETPAVEFVETLGKFLPESQTPDGGIFSFQNEDDEWIALRYDLTASLSRVCAQYKDIQRPFRRCQVGPVYRLEKPGPDHFREFYQFDFDTVGTKSMMADAEGCCVLCDALEKIGIERGNYLIKVNNRKILNGVLETSGVGLIDTSTDDSRAMNVLRSIDKYDRIGLKGVKELLTTGREDASGDVMKGLGLSENEISPILEYLQVGTGDRVEVCDQLESIVGNSEIGMKGIEELREIDKNLRCLGYEEGQIVFDPTVVRGLGYYTGPVFEAVLTFEVKDEKGRVKSFGSIGGGGRYDDLVKRFTGQEVPATGASIGVDRLLEALKLVGKLEERSTSTSVLVAAMDKNHLFDYQLIAKELRSAGINTELYLGNKGIGGQFKYADKCKIPLVVVAGEDEFSAGELQIKDLEAGRELAKEVLDRETWRKDRPAQFAVKREDLVAKIKETLNL
ncbi:MAG: histidine--tRNA ligase [Calditrichaeota bacterium]|jgi:histidyl-tRNA synthetase|nr:histidine--tRNA ligase [Calditrichota bacterium]MBT7788069.1 histidine--tRNA ligase [Calditrichota bacterium]